MSRVFTINRSTTKMPRECAAVGCAELKTKGSLFSFHTFPKDSSRRKLHPWRLELEIVPSRLPCGHPHRHDFFLTRGYRSRIARLSLGWSLVDGRKGLFGWNRRPCQFYKEYIQTDQRTQKYILTPWHPVQRLKLKKGEKPFSQETLQKKKGKSTKEANEHTNPQQEWTRNKCRRRRRRRERKKTNKKQMDMVNTEKRKEKQEVQLLNYQQIPLPCLRNQTKARQKLNENNGEKSKSRKVNRNSAGLCPNE